VTAETRKGLASAVAHPVGYLAGLLIVAVMFLGMQFIAGQGTLRRSLLPETLVAISAFFFVNAATLVMVADLVEEKRGGPFAQSQLTPAPPWLLLAGRLATASVLGLGAAVAGTAVPMLVARVTIPVRWAALIPYSLTLVNVLAFTFLMAAIALTSPVILTLHSLTSAMIIMLNGSMLPLAFYPAWLAVVARIVPTTLGIEATGKILFRGASLAGIWADGTLPWLLGYTLGLIAAGAALFARNYRTTLRDGWLGRY
jgi:ABC-2 type transport system permease protein